MKTPEEKAKYSQPRVLDHKPIRFETAQSWNPGTGNLDHYGTGDDGTSWPSTNPNPTPGGAGYPSINYKK